MADDRRHSNTAASAAATPTAVGIDRDKNSQQAVKWATDHLNAQDLILIHVRNKNHSGTGFNVSEATNDASREHIEADMEELFLPYKGFCARRKVNLKEVILEDADVAKAISDYITANNIPKIVVGASNKNTLAKRLWQPDMPANLMRIAPEFCTVYVVCKGKAVHTRAAKGPLPSNAAPPKQPSAGPGHLHDPDDAVKTPFARGRKVAAAAAAAAHLCDQRSLERSTGHTKHAPNLPGTKTAQNNLTSHDAAEHLSHRLRRFSGGSRDLEDATDGLYGKLGFHSNDSSDSAEYQFASGDSYGASPDHNSRRELEAEMRRLKLELKQTMDMYSNACKEAITAKQKAKQLVELKMEEAQRFEEARNAEKAAIAMAEMEKAKCRAALEAAEASQRIAELEAQKRRQAELKAKREGEEKMRAMDALVNNDVRYRRYTIEEIELATENFADSLKVGEGGYGPVFRACLDHTPVAIKILRPDAAQGRKQFNQEVEVLSCIRHPNMVLLLGACPEYGCLVYEYMDNGSLEDRLFRRGNTRPIPWAVRFKIAAEIATALLFLHQAKPEPLVHRDLKPANILLDRNYVSKISDVGLARLVPPSVADSVTQYRMTSTAGTFCYIDPEYQQTGMLGCKSDIYSLGVMLLQMITARPAMALSHHVERAIERGCFEEVLDPAVKDWPVGECLSYAKLALKCAELRKKDRPDLATVILPELNRLRNLGHHYRTARR